MKTTNAAYWLQTTKMECRILMLMMLLEIGPLRSQNWKLHDFFERTGTERACFIDIEESYILGPSRIKLKKITLVQLGSQDPSLMRLSRLTPLFLSRPQQWGPTTRVG
jgi:hypothetical protein